jgi:16S rRNA processing protein RimM
MKSQEQVDESEPLIVIARAVRTRGLKGELVADLLTDFPERFEQITKLFAVSPDGARHVIELERTWFQNDRVILKLSGCDSIEAAQAFVGFEFAVPEAERVELAEDEFYDWELEGCKVETIAGVDVGAVTNVLRTGGVDLLLVENDQKQSVMVPMVKTIVVSIDAAGKSILIDPPEGLLEL